MDLAKKPGEGLEAWKKAYVETKKPTSDAQKAANALPAKSAKKPADLSSKAATDASKRVPDGQEKPPGGAAGPKATKVRIHLPPDLQVPYGTSIAILNRRLGKNRAFVWELAAVRANGLGKNAAKRLIDLLAASLLGFKGE